MRPDVVLLDVMLPGFDGLEVCRRIQAERPVPVLMLTARDDEADVLVGSVSAPTTTSPSRSRCARSSRASPPCCAASSGPPRWPTSGRPPSLVGRDQHRPRHPAYDRRRRAGAPHADGVRPAALPGPRGRARCSAASGCSREVWDWGDAWGSASAARTVDSHVKALRSKVGAARIRTVHGVGYALEDVA